MSPFDTAPEVQHLFHAEASIDNVSLFRAQAPIIDIEKRHLSNQIAEMLVHKHFQVSDGKFRTTLRLSVYMMTGEELSRVIKAHIDAASGFHDPNYFASPNMKLQRFE